MFFFAVGDVSGTSALRPQNSFVPSKRIVFLGRSKVLHVNIIEVDFTFNNQQPKKNCFAADLLLLLTEWCMIEDDDGALALQTGPARLNRKLWRLRKWGKKVLKQTLSKQANTPLRYRRRRRRLQQDLLLLSAKRHLVAAAVAAGTTTRSLNL